MVDGVAEEERELSAQDDEMSPDCSVSEDGTAALRLASAESASLQQRYTRSSALAEQHSVIRQEGSIESGSQRRSSRGDGQRSTAEERTKGGSCEREKKRREAVKDRETQLIGLRCSRQFRPTAVLPRVLCSGCCDVDAAVVLCGGSGSMCWAEWR